MAGPFDSTLKQLLDAFPADWARFLAEPLGLPPDVRVEPVDVDLSTVQIQADRVFRLLPPVGGLLHLEPQASWDRELPERLLEYSVLLERRYGGPVHSVALLLRPAANTSTLTGTLVRSRHSGRDYLRFDYDVVRVWELNPERLYQAGIGTAPLALLTDAAANDLGGHVDRLDADMQTANTAEPIRQLVLTCGYILLGLRYDDVRIHEAFLRAKGMKESSTYQAILREGRQEGRQLGGLEARQDDILNILRHRFATVSADVEKRIRSTTDSARLQAAILQSIQVSSPEDLQL